MPQVRIIAPNWVSSQLKIQLRVEIVTKRVEVFGSQLLICHWCLSDAVKVLSGAVVAPWILENQKNCGEAESLSFYCLCNSCGLHFFSRRFSEEELNTIYSHYRDSSYQKKRQRYEPWYTEKVNLSIGNDLPTIKVRQENLKKLICEAHLSGIVDLPKVIVDWGGDKGQFIPIFGSSQQSYVYEVSDATPAFGVDRLFSTDQIEQKLPDLFMVCHVLEHDHGARNLVSKIAALAKPSSLLYVEVPLDRTEVIPNRLPPSKQILKHRFFWIFIDFYSLVTMRVLKLKLPFQVLKQSEHVNFFCQKSLVKVVETLDFKLIIAKEFCLVKSKSGAPESKALGVLFKRQ